MAKRRRKARKSHGRRRSHRRMHGLGEMDMAPMMMAGLGQFDYGDSGMSTTTKVLIGAAVVFVGYKLFMSKPAAAAPVSTEEVKAIAADTGAAAGAAAGGAVAEKTVAKLVVGGGSSASSSLFGLNGKGYFSGLGNLGRGYYSGWQGQGDSGTAFQAAGRGFNYGRYF